MNESAHSGSENRQPILFFDGVCGLCNRFVDLVLRADKQDRFRYAPLQGETAHRLLGLKDEGEAHETDGTPAGNSQAGGPRSFVFLETDRRYEQSNAVLLALSRLGGAWRLVAVLYVFPRPLRDFVYRIVARNRYRWFGKRDACRVPTPEEQDRFLP
ncbi:MAG: thiol-disulfide oxidoreductase DCC family protein [Gemmatimonadetes bacterium]|nr:thiol-disulfide oxidoreductase DCC family protein [Gemmatimonadota bacterium]